jgi:predicted Zn-dependent protease
MGSEAQLAGVLGHEIGHVTARHSASRLSKAQLATIGLGVGSVLSEEVARFSGVAQAGLGLLFLDFSRNDEREADALGLRYMTRAGYDGRELVEVFRMLERVSAASGSGRLPNWLATHPTPEDREARLRAAIGAAAGATSGRVERDGFLRRLDGLVFGDDPREGYFLGDTFHHPGLRFRIQLPRGYARQNTKQAVTALSPEKDAAFTLTLAEGGSAAAALDAFLTGSGVRRSATRRASVGGLAGAEADFEATGEGGTLRGRALFVQCDQRVYRLLAYAAADRWAAREGVLDAAQRSFQPERERRYLDVEPARLAIVHLDRPTALSELARRYPSAVDLQELGRLNGVAEDGTLPAGLAKRVAAGRVPQ